MERPSCSGPFGGDPKGTSFSAWTASVSETLIRTISDLLHGFGGSIFEAMTASKATGQFLATEECPHKLFAGYAELLDLSPCENQTLRSRILYAYNSLGTLRVSAQDVNLSGTTGLAGPDVVSSKETSYAFLDSV